MKRFKTIMSAALAFTVLSSATVSLAEVKNHGWIVLPEKIDTVLVNPFEDTYEKWYDESVAFAYTNGYIKGVSSSSFAPDDNVTCSELAAILYRVAGEPTVSMNSDVPDEWFTKSNEWVIENKIASGFDNAFSGDRPLLREEIVSMFYEFFLTSGIMFEKAELGKFTDCKEVSEFAKDAFSWAVSFGVIMGDERSKLNPKDNVTRGETAAMLYRFIKQTAEKIN